MRLADWKQFSGLATFGGGEDTFLERHSVRWSMHCRSEACTEENDRVVNISRWISKELSLVSIPKRLGWRWEWQKNQRVESHVAQR